MRRYIRHPVGIPIEVTAQTQKAHATHKTVNLGIGGLAFRCDWDYAQGEVVGIRIPFVQPLFDVEARVAWCKPHGDGFEMGVEFRNQDDAFMARMVEQVCHIENYQKAVLRAEGRQLSHEEAAREWNGKFAATFPGS